MGVEAWGGRRLGKRLFLGEQTNPVREKREEKTPICKQTAGLSLTGYSNHSPPTFTSKLLGRRGGGLGKKKQPT